MAFTIKIRDVVLRLYKIKRKDSGVLTWILCWPGQVGVTVLFLTYTWRFWVKRGWGTLTVCNVVIIIRSLITIRHVQNSKLLGWGIQTVFIQWLFWLGKLWAGRRLEPPKNRQVRNPWRFLRGFWLNKIPNTRGFLFYPLFCRILVFMVYISCFQSFLPSGFHQ